MVRRRRMGDPSVNLLYRWPDAAQSGSRIPKEKIYGYRNCPTAVREKFVAEVRRITWAYKLRRGHRQPARQRHGPGDPGVPDRRERRRCFRVGAGRDRQGHPVPDHLRDQPRSGQDRARPQAVAAHKQLGSGTPRLSAYYSTSWQPADIERQPLPTVITLPALYTAPLDPLAPVTVRPGEDVSEVAARLDATRRLEREIAVSERKLRTELAIQPQDRAAPDPEDEASRVGLIEMKRQN